MDPPENGPPLDTLDPRHRPCSVRTPQTRRPLPSTRNLPDLGRRGGGRAATRALRDKRTTMKMLVHSNGLGGDCRLICPHVNHFHQNGELGWTGCRKGSDNAGTVKPGPLLDSPGPPWTCPGPPTPTQFGPRFMRQRSEPACFHVHILPQNLLDSHAPRPCLDPLKLVLLTVLDLCLFLCLTRVL